MQTRGPSPSHWNNGKPMTPRERKKRAGYLAHIQRQQAAQVGADPARNVGGTDPLDVVLDGGIVMLEHVDD
jgi:hypothetical protein